MRRNFDKLVGRGRRNHYANTLFSRLFGALQAPYPRREDEAAMVKVRWWIRPLEQPLFDRLRDGAAARVDFQLCVDIAHVHVNGVLT